MIRFKTIRFSNFLSIGQNFAEYKLDTDDMTLIIGENGSGKSVLLDAITFSLFNKPFRKINKSAIPNSVNKKDCVVEIEFETNGSQWKVVRGIKPNIFEIYENDVLVDQDRDQQDYLETTVLKMGFKTFCQVVILGSATYTPFMKLAAQDRREVIDDFLMISVFTTMSVLAKQKMTTIKEEMRDLESKIDAKKDLLKYIEKQINEQDKDNSQESDNLSKMIKMTSSELDKAKKHLDGFLEKEVSAAREKLKDTKAFQDELSKLLSFEGKIQNKMDASDKQKKFLEENSSCPVCEQEIEDGFRNKKIDEANEEHKKFDHGLKEIYGQIVKVREKIQEAEEDQKKYNTLQFEVQKTEALISNLEKEKARYENELNKLTGTDKGSVLSKAINDKKQTELELEHLYRELDEKTDEFDVAEMGIRHLKDSGIKTSVINQYLPVINDTINQFLKSMDFMVDFELDETFNETIKSRYRDIFSYYNFSEGEKARIDLALMLTWRTIAKSRNSVTTNLIIFDEVFDGSLDGSGSYELVEILRKMCGENSVFVISHREDMKDHFEKVIEVKKNGNYSVMKEV